MNEIVMLPVGQLYHHPENPRKDLGDLSELAESIRKNGIMQNLTVISGRWRDKDEYIRDCQAEGVTKDAALGTYDSENSWTADGYTVVIGNRRMEAAKLAGMSEVPCVISDMDHKTQISTMLEENMQRADLTVYEQAQGFQMMMDLGYTAKEIGEKTGFSEKTVKDRIKFTKFNQKNFQKAVEKGATLMDMIEISKLKSKEDQNAVMAEAGTNNFRQKLLSKLAEQTYNEGCVFLEKLAVEAELVKLPDNVSVYSAGYSWTDCKITSTDAEEKIRRALKKVRKDNPGEVLVYRFSRGWNEDKATMNVLKQDKKKDASELTDEEKAAKEKEHARQKHVREVKKLWAEAYRLRTDFIRNYTVTNGYGMTTIGKLIAKYALTQQNSWNHKLPDNQHWKEKYIKEVLGIQQEDYEDKKSVLEVAEARGIPMIRTTIAWICGGGVFDADSPEFGLFHYYDGSYTTGGMGMLKERYEFLKEIGYVMSDMETQLMDGTHPAYGGGGQG